jgi:hypothetical protein
MHRDVTGLLRFGVAPLLFGLASMAAGCTGSGIGDPCIPESIPADGFDSREVYLETSSVQCRTRVCMVYRLEGDPRQVIAEDPEMSTCPAGSTECVTEQAVDQQVFCSCRCSVSEGEQANTPLCNCGDGFTCVDDVVTTGGVGVRGGYCVPCIKPDDDRDLDPTVFEDCPAN